MKLAKRVRRLILVGAALAAIAAPAAGAGVMPGTYVQIDGKLVDPAHLSAVEAQAGAPASSHLVQLGGKLVRPDQLSAEMRRLSSGPTVVSSSDEGSGWTAWNGIEIGVLAALLLAAGALGVAWRRGQPSTA